MKQSLSETPEFKRIPTEEEKNKYIEVLEKERNAKTVEVRSK